MLKNTFQHAHYLIMRWKLKRSLLARYVSTNQIIPGDENCFFLETKLDSQCWWLYWCSNGWSSTSLWLFHTWRSQWIYWEWCIKWSLCTWKKSRFHRSFSRPETSPTRSLPSSMGWYLLHFTRSYVEHEHISRKSFMPYFSAF